ncbi:MAG: WecB/TagA/CpsF family glycosyltransferase [Cytophagales bacterium]|nr:WecB/TagA/CpsF family glycosyltransferase [Cytophagales bacterium]MDW8384063.1 WecB/TagA/CpsF family glycosyltransferase [Flammeovirgaceae bacterium]
MKVPYKILNLSITKISCSQALDLIVKQSIKYVSSFVCFANAHMVVEAWLDKSFAEQVNRADLVFADGKPLTWALRFLYNVHQERIAGMDFMPSLLEKCNQYSLSVFFYGSSPEVLEKIKTRVEKELPQCRIVGMISPPFRALTDEEQENHIQQINQSGANIVFVALGCPKQEKWCAENYAKIKAVLLPVGGAFPVYARMQARAPKWMQHYGLEWLYRLYQEPHRLWKRYLITNTLFILGVVLQKLKFL